MFEFCTKKCPYKDNCNIDLYNSICYELIYEKLEEKGE